MHSTDNMSWPWHSAMSVPDSVRAGSWLVVGGCEDTFVRETPSSTVYPSECTLKLLA